jgi:hypothetical protein
MYPIRSILAYIIIIICVVASFLRSSFEDVLGLLVIVLSTKFLDSRYALTKVL